MKLFAVTVWLIWTQRNKTRLQKTPPALHHVEQLLKDLLPQIVPSPGHAQSLPRQSGNRTRWVPSPRDLMKFNFDGAVFASENKAGIGVVVMFTDSASCIRSRGSWSTGCSKSPFICKGNWSLTSCSWRWFFGINKGTSWWEYFFCILWVVGWWCEGNCL